MRAAFALVVLLSGVAAGYDPGATGRFAVGSTTLTLVDAPRGRTLVTEVWYPAATAGRDVALRRGRFPLVLDAHGNCGFRTNYEYLTTHLASRGFVVAAPDFPGINRDACDAGPETGLTIEPPVDLAFLATTFSDRGGDAARFARAVRTRHVGLVGHSLGGLAVLNAALADDRFTTVVALAPLASAALGASFAGLTPRRAVAVLGGTADTTLPMPVTAIPLFGALPAPGFLVTITGGTHSGFTDMDARLTLEQLARQQAIVRRYATALLDRYLRGNRRTARVLTAVDATAQGGDVMLATRPR